MATRTGLFPVSSVSKPGGKQSGFKHVGFSAKGKGRPEKTSSRIMPNKYGSHSVKKVPISTKSLPAPSSSRKSYPQTKTATPSSKGRSSCRPNQRKSEGWTLNFNKKKAVVEGNKKTPKKSILKKEADIVKTEKKSSVTETDPGTRHVKFNTKATDQASLRVKLQEWLEAKGKTPSRCRHLMCFDAEMSEKKKKVKLLNGRISENVLAEQAKVLKNEDVRKKLFKEAAAPEVKSEKAPDSKQLKTSEKENTEPETIQPVTQAGNDQDEEMPVLSSEALEKVFENLKSMLDECLTLFLAGLPLDHVLAWLKEMETQIPEALKFSHLYITKAKVLSSSPSDVLAIFCEAVRNNAQPVSELSEAMHELLSPFLPYAHPPSPWESPALPLMDQAHSTPMQEMDSYVMEDESMDKSAANLSLISDSTPLTDPLVPVNEGSTVKYSISETPYLTRKTPESALLAVVTPVRRSNRLSNRQSTPGLRREVNSVSELSEVEKENMLFRVNTALTGED